MHVAVAPHAAAHAALAAALKKGVHAWCTPRTDRSTSETTLRVACLRDGTNIDEAPFVQFGVMTLLHPRNALPKASGIMDQEEMT